VVLCQLSVGEAQDAKTQALKVDVSGSVPLKGGAVAVVTPGVRLDDHALVTPEEIHFVRADARVHLWLGKAVSAAKASKDPLELAARELGLALEIL
jgi:hypothetical protein